MPVGLQELCARFLAQALPSASTRPTPVHAPTAALTYSHMFHRDICTPLVVAPGYGCIAEPWHTCRGLKRGTLGGRSPEALALLNPQLPLLVRALASRAAPVVSLSLRILASLVQLPLKGAQPTCCRHVVG